MYVQRYTVARSRNQFRHGKKKYVPFLRAFLKLREKTTVSFVIWCPWIRAS